MKVLCRREELLSAFQQASVAVPARDVKPVLRNVKAIAEEDRCTLLATDLELGARLEVVGLTVEEPGVVLLPAARLHAILRESPDETLVVQTADQSCLVRGDHSEFELAGEDPANFPDVPVFAADAYHEMRAGALREMIRRTAFAVATDSSRYAITGVLCELEGPTARLVATDGRRLAVAEREAVAHGEHSTRGKVHILPARAVQLLDRNLHDPQEVVRVSLSPNEALFRTTRATIYTRLVEGRFPPYRDVLPKKPPVKVMLPVDAFHAAVRQAAIMTDQESRKIVLGFAKGKLTLRGQGADVGRSRVQMPLEYEGKALEIAFNPQLLADMLRALHGAEAIELALTNATSPALFRCGENYSHVIMPLT